MASHTRRETDPVAVEMIAAETLEIQSLVKAAAERIRAFVATK